jgi:hypothetical protein
MCLIVGIHGIGQQFKAASVVHNEWLHPLRGGLEIAGAKLEEESDLGCPFYGDLFRPPRTKSAGLPPLRALDLDDELERDLLEAWWLESAKVENGRVPDPDELAKGRTPNTIQKALNALSYSRFFACVAERVQEWIVADLKQVSAYLLDSAIRQGIRERVVNVVSKDSRVLIGHSLGSIVAYECLCAHPEWPVHTLITIGSPLGIRNLIFDRLKPSPTNGVGVWPGTVHTWVNIADGGDIVALVKDLKTGFGPKVQNHLIFNGADAHGVMPYLTARETGNAIAAAIR